MFMPFGFSFCVIFSALSFCTNPIIHQDKYEMESRLHETTSAKFSKLFRHQSLEAGLHKKRVSLLFFRVMMPHAA